MEVIWGIGRGRAATSTPAAFRNSSPMTIGSGGGSRAFYTEIWKATAPAHLVDIGVFCDSDNTRAAKHLSRVVRLERR